MEKSKHPAAKDPPAKAKRPWYEKLPPWAKVAEYYEGDLLPEHKKCPLISALGRYLSDEDYALMLASPVQFDAREKSYSPEWRMHAISRLQDLVIVRPPNIVLASDLHRLIRSHYMSLNIRDNGLADFKDPFAIAADSGELVFVRTGRRNHAYCKGIFGLSGTGKTTAVMSSLLLWKQVYYHLAYGVAQVVWLKVDCPRSMSIKDTLKTIIQTYDFLLGGTHYLDEIHKGATLADYANKVARIARKHCTGMIVLDEVQFALDATRLRDPLLDFFVYFSNVVDVPLVLCGTPRAEKLFEKTLYLGRRVVSGGSRSWTRITNLKDWDYICKKVGMYQWLKNALPLDDRLRAFLLELTAGLLGILIPLFQLAQYRAIRSGEERLSKKLFTEVFHEEMRLIVPMVEAIRSGKENKMAKFEDIFEARMLSIEGQLDAEAEQCKFYEELLESTKLEAATDAVSRLNNIGVTQERGFALVRAVQVKRPNATSTQLFEEVARLIVAKGSGAEERSGAGPNSLRAKQSKIT